MDNKIYVCIDLKSFYASVECVERGLDPLTAKLVVADPDRTEKTICLAVSPAMKAAGVKNRCRVFQIPPNMDYIMAVPRMGLYIEYSANIYAIYLKYIAKEDIHVYSIDEVFLDVTNYLAMYQMTARELGIRIMKDIFETVGITATCGIGSNMYLAKVALDITAKHVSDHIGELTEESYCKTLWKHRPLTDFWRIGPGISARLEKYGIYDMEGIAHANEDLLYKLFGIDAELLIDHAWGRETTTMADIKNYKPSTNSLSSGQVLGCDADTKTAKLLVKEMADLLCLDLVDKGLATASITLYLGYNHHVREGYSNGTLHLDEATSSAKKILPQLGDLYDRIVEPGIPIHRINMSFNNLVDEAYEQYGLFEDPAELEKERKMQQAMLELKKRFGKNAVLRGMNLEEGAKTMARNDQIGGHRK